MASNAFIRWFDDLSMEDVASVGGKNASLGELTRALKPQGVRVPSGFAVTSDAYWAFLDANGLRPEMTRRLDALERGEAALDATGRELRRMLNDAPFPDDLRRAILDAHAELRRREGRADGQHLSVAVRSSATAEDLPDASFAGQQETYLNVEGDAALLEACRNCVASLFTDRAIAYRRNQGYDHMKVALSVGVQVMVRADVGSSGVIFTLDTESGFPDVVMITAGYGLGENIVKGVINPDEFYVFKPLLKNEALRPIVRKTLGAKEKTMILSGGARGTTRNVNTPKDDRRRFCIADDEILLLARWAARIEERYSNLRGHHVPMDIEWAKDGLTGDLYIVQARPETVHSRKMGEPLKTYTLKEKGRELVRGRSVGASIADGEVCLIRSAADINRFKDGSILVAEMTDPDWVPIMKRARGIITDHGGRTCHAAIVSRELGIPAIVGANHATDTLKDGQAITLSCAGGEEGVVYEGRLAYETREVRMDEIGDPGVKIMMNLASPSGAFQWWKLPCDGVGLARMEFIITNEVRAHPMALVHPDRVATDAERKQIDELTRGHENGAEFFVETLSRGVAMIAASRYPHPVVVRMSDFKTNEYAGLLGGAAFEPKEENPMIGFRGASRYYHERYRDGFRLELRAMKRAREVLGLDNIILMIPFCRTPEEADRVLELMAEEGLTRGERGLKIYVMCEIPSNVILTEEFAKRFDGFSIGSNDLTQLALGVDRDSEILAPLFDERHPAIKRLIEDVIRRAHACGVPVGICGQAPSDHADFAEFLVDAGIDSISLNPDSVVPVRRRLAERKTAAKK